MNLFSVTACYCRTDQHSLIIFFPCVYTFKRANKELSLTYSTDIYSYQKLSEEHVYGTTFFSASY